MKMKPIGKRVVEVKRLPLSPKLKARANLVNLSVQIPAEVDVRLSAQATSSGLSKNLIARQAVQAAIQMMERDGGLFLPLVFPEQGIVG